MEKIKLLLIEDDDGDISLCQDAIKEIQEEINTDIGINVCKTFEDALMNLDNSYDGAIIDIKLINNDTGGSQIIEKIKEHKFKFPVTVYTATPMHYKETPNIKSYTKGKNNYKEILDYLTQIYKTGITRIMGGRGKIEETLYDVYDKILIPDLEIWQNYAKKKPELTEKALLRFTLNHLWQLLDDNNEKYFPEEFYIKKPGARRATGSIFKEIKNGAFFVLLSPSCDLVEREGKINAEKLILAEIEPFRDWLKDVKKKDRKSLKDKLKQNPALYRHLVPATRDFNGGFVNFRKLITIAPEQFENMFEWYPLQIAAPFIRNIQSRFASYYARQGEPETDSDFLIENLLEQNP